MRVSESSKRESVECPDFEESTPTEYILCLGCALTFILAFVVFVFYCVRPTGPVDSLAPAKKEEPKGYMTAPKLNLTGFTPDSWVYWSKLASGLLFAMTAICAVPLYKHIYRRDSGCWWLCIPGMLLSYQLIGWGWSRGSTLPDKPFDWSRVVCSNDKLNIKVTTWNTFMFPVAALDQINKRPFFCHQTSNAERCVRFIKENEDFQNSDIVLLQEVFSPGQNFLTNMIEGFWSLAGHPTHGRETMIQGLKDAGFPYVTGRHMPWYQTFLGLYDSGLLIGSKLPFEDVRFSAFKTYGNLEMYGACKGILSVKIPIKSAKGKRILGTLYVGTAHTEFGTDCNNCFKPGDAHPQYAMARNHLMDRAAGTPGLVSVVIGGDWNSDNKMPNFKSSNATFYEAGGHPENLYSLTDMPPTPAFNAYGKKYENSIEFLKKKIPIKFDYNGCGAWAIDQIFGLEDTEACQRKAVLSDVKRVMLHFKDSTDAQKITENTLTWIRQWNETWIKQGEKGLEAAVGTARLLIRDVISDHFPIMSGVNVDFGKHN